MRMSPEMILAELNDARRNDPVDAASAGDFAAPRAGHSSGGGPLHGYDSLKRCQSVMLYSGANGLLGWFVKTKDPWRHVVREDCVADAATLALALLPPSVATGLPSCG